MAQDKKTTEEFRFAIEYYIFRENDYLIAYCPSLDISTSGKDYPDAIKNFYEQFQIYVETCLELGTLWDDPPQPRVESDREKTDTPAFQSSCTETRSVTVARWPYQLRESIHTNAESVNFTEYIQL